MADEAKFATYPSLRDRCVVITGGATGIGRAMVAAFGTQGAKVAFLDCDEQSGRELAREAGDNVHFIACDVSDAVRLKSAVGESERMLGGIQVLIANAADDTRHALDDVTPELWDACMAVNLKHQFFAAQAAYPAIAAAGGGSIICLGSISWLNNTTGMVGYTTAKAGIHGLVRTLACLLGPMGIRVNALLPGWTMTERQLDNWIDEAAEQEIKRSQCLIGRVMPEDIARMALFLTADDSKMCTKQTFIVDAGWL